VLLFAVVVFEVDVRTHGWKERAAGQLGGEPSSGVYTALYVHLVFAVTTVILWPVVIVRAIRNFPIPPAPAAHSAWHKRWAWVATAEMVLTSVTGWIFYWMAFVR
jgi:putative membrane protein